MSMPIPGIKPTNAQASSRSTSRCMRSPQCSISGTSRQRRTSKQRAPKARHTCSGTMKRQTSGHCRAVSTGPSQYPTGKRNNKSSLVSIAIRTMRRFRSTGFSIRSPDDGDQQPTTSWWNPLDAPIANTRLPRRRWSNRSRLQTKRQLRIAQGCSFPERDFRGS
jgi:hypothetical protein